MSRFRNIITRSVGFEPQVRPDLLTLELKSGDVFVICSDGLSNYFSDDELTMAFSNHYPQDLPQLLVNTANDRGGEDNITCIVVSVVGDTADAGEAAPSEVAGDEDPRDLTQKTTTNADSNEGPA